MLLFFPSVNYRIKDEVCYQNEINKLTMEGKYLIADYYNKTYFLKDNPTKKIVLASSFNELKKKIKQAQISNYQLVGFVFSNGSLGHTSPIIFEKTVKGSHYLYIADGVQLSTCLANALKEFCDKNAILLCITIFQRQMDVSSCHSEALTYLKNALQQPTIYDYVKLFKPQDIQEESILQELKNYPGYSNWEWYIFLESADMLKTSQNSKVLHFNPEVSLFSTKKKLSYTEKMTPYQKLVNYTHSEDALLTKTFSERTYLRHKTSVHAKKLQAFKEEYSESMLKEKINSLKNQR